MTGIDYEFKFKVLNSCHACIYYFTMLSQFDEGLHLLTYFLPSVCMKWSTNESQVSCGNKSNEEMT